MYFVLVVYMFLATSLMNMEVFGYSKFVAFGKYDEKRGFWTYVSTFSLTMWFGFVLF